MRESASTDLREPQGSNPLGPPGPELWQHGDGAGLAVRQERGTGSPLVRAEAYANDLARRRMNDRHLPGIRIPEDTLVTACAREAMDGADLIVAAVPISFLRSTLTALSDRVPAGIPFLSVVKGIENGTFNRPSQIIVETLGERPVAVLSGPSHAEEIGRGLPASVVVAGSSMELNQAVQENLSHEPFRVYTNPDAVGVELAGALTSWASPRASATVWALAITPRPPC